MQEALAAKLLLDERPGGLAGAKAGDADARRELPVGFLDRLVVALGLDLDFELDLTLW
jgi:hypothetical protein